MALTFQLSDFDDYKFEDVDVPSFNQLLELNKFKNDDAYIAILSCGGTISSAYSAKKECILPTSKSTITETLEHLDTSFGTAETNITSASLLKKDSRDISVNDIKYVLDTINKINNNRIIVSFGTYGLPLLTQIVDRHTVDKNKTVILTGSMLISTMKEHDVDFNAGGAISLVNGLHEYARDNRDHALVCLAFHGKIYTSDECRSLDLHPDSHAEVLFYKGQRLV